jgi:hypothetical protein
VPAHERRQKYLRETCVKLQSDLRSQGIDNQYVEVGLKETFLNDMEIAICNTKQPSPSSPEIFQQKICR